MLSLLEALPGCGSSESFRIGFVVLESVMFCPKALPIGLEYRFVGIDGIDD